MVNAHILDGVALTKFIFWIKEINKNKITEVEAAKKLERFRKMSKSFLILVLIQLQVLEKMVLLCIIELEKKIVEI